MTDLDTRHRDRPPVPVPAPEGEHPGGPFGLIALVGLIVLAGVAGGWSLLVMIGAIVVMVFLHELGHFLTAKWAGMKVTEFFIGFGPRIWSFRRGDTEYGIKPIPAGAYVKIVGMHNLDEYDPADEDRTYMSKPFWRRLSVAVAGSTMHFLLALLALFVAYSLVGVPGGRALIDESDLDAVQDGAAWTVREVADGSGADAADLELGDRVLSVDGVAIPDWGTFSEVVSSRADRSVPVVIERDGRRSTVEVDIGRREDDEDRGFFGVGPDLEITGERLGVVDSFEQTGSTFGSAVGATFSGLADILSPSGLADLGERAFTGTDGPAVDEDSGGGSGGGGGGGSSDGPNVVGILGITDGGAQLLDDGQWGEWLVVFALINVFIGIFNLVPLLPLDGGHVAIAVYEKIRSMLRRGEPYHVDVVKLLPLTYAVVLVLIFLGVSTIVLDTRTLAGG